MLLPSLRVFDSFFLKGQVKVGESSLVHFSSGFFNRQDGEGVRTKAPRLISNHARGCGGMGLGVARQQEVVYGTILWGDNCNGHRRCCVMGTFQPMKNTAGDKMQAARSESSGFRKYNPRAFMLTSATVTTAIAVPSRMVL